MSIALVRPNIETELFKIYSESHSLGYLAALLRETGIETDIIDAYLENMDLYKLVQRVIKEEYKIIGFTIFGANSLEWTKKAAELIKREASEIHIIIGGHFPSFDYEYILKKIPEIDSIARFEGEYILFKLVRAILNKQDWKNIKGLAFRYKDKIVSNKPATLIQDLDSLPFPKRDYIPFLIKNHSEEFTVNINRGRGCYNKCKFCSVPRFYQAPKGKIFRQRSNKNLLEEIEYLKNTYMINNFSFIDDDFIHPSKEGRVNTIALAEEIIKRRLNINFSISERIDCLHKGIIDALISAGLVKVFVGLEAANENILKELGKKISKKKMENSLDYLLAKNIDIEISFINFLPFNSLQDIRENVVFFSQWGFDTLRSICNRLEPYPGTIFHQELQREGNLKRDGFFCDYFANKIDPRVDDLFEIIKKSSIVLSFISHRLRSIKSILWKNKEFLNDFNFFHGQLFSAQKTIANETSDIIINIIKELEKHKKIDFNSISNKVYNKIWKDSEEWLSHLIEIKNSIKREANYGKNRLQKREENTM